MTPQNDNSRITNRQVYDLLHELKTEVSIMKHKLDNEITKNDRLLQDHESRLRKMEETIWRSAWVSGLISALATAVVGGVLVAIVTGKI